MLRIVIVGHGLHIIIIIIVTRCYNTLDFDENVFLFFSFVVISNTVLLISGTVFSIKIISVLSHERSVKVS